MLTAPVLARWLVVGALAAGAVGVPAVSPHAQDIPAPDGTESGTLYLDVVINGLSRAVVLEVRREADGAWTVDPEQLRRAGLIPAEVAKYNVGRIDLNQLPGVRFSYDEATQSLRVNADPAARAPLVVNAARRPPATRPEPDGDIGALLNYSVAFDPGYVAEADEVDLGDLNGSFEARIFGPVGVLSHQFVMASGDEATAYRQNTSWSYAQPDGAWRLTAGDFTTGSLDWTRPTRLAGMQFKNDFSLQPDVVTFPVPGMSGSAALPSTAEVYVNGVQRFSTAVPDGPFSIEGMPLSTGSGMAVLVVRDQNGREVSIERPFFVAKELLRPGLLDYAFEVGFPRSFFGTERDQYDSRLMASTSLRYGVTDWLTLEGHAEGGDGLVNAGIGAVASIADRGVVQLAVSGSLADAAEGYQLFGALSFELLGTRVRARVQGTIGDYQDIASFTYPDAAESAAPPLFLAQLSADAPLPIEPLRLNLSYTELDSVDEGRQRVLGLGFNQSLWGGNLSASASLDIVDHDYRTTLSFSRAIGDEVRAGSYVSGGASGVRASARVGVPMGSEIGDTGWQVLFGQGENTRLSAGLQTRLPAATTEASLSYDGETVSGSGRVAGAIVATAAGLALANPITDAFAVVDAGYPGVPVLVENQEVGVTGPDGKFVVANLRGYEANRVGIDSSDLPLDAVVLSTRQDIVPADRSGVVVTFGGDEGGSALVTFRDASGAFLPVGTIGQASSSAPPFMVGYDGKAYVVGLGPTNRIELTLPEGGRCRAQFPFVAEAGAQVASPDIVCHPI